MRPEEPLIRTPSINDNVAGCRVTADCRTLAPERANVTTDYNCVIRIYPRITPIHTDKTQEGLSVRIREGPWPSAHEPVPDHAVS